MANERKKLNRLNDALLKFVFAQEERKQVTQSFINAFFEAEGTPQLVDFEFRDRELNAERKIAKRSHLDILGSCSDGTLTNVEVQIDPIKAMPVRTLFYWSWLYRRLVRGDDYTKLKRTVSIDVLAFNLFPEDETPDYHNCFAILNKKYPKHMLTDHLELHFVELPKWETNRPKNWKDMSRLDKWLAYFSSKTPDEEMEEIAMSDSMIQEALNAENAFMLDPAMLSAYDAAEEARRDQAARDSYLLDEGIKKGMRQGKEEVVVELLRAHQPIELIVRCSNFSEAEVLAVGKRNGLL